MPDSSQRLPDIRQHILTLIKQRGEVTNAELAAHFRVSYEAMRQHLRQLEALQLVHSHRQRGSEKGAGRPTTVYTLTTAGDHLFPKAYDELALDLLDTLAAALGPDALREVLATLTENNVEFWQPLLEDKALAERLEALRGFYLEDDVYMEAETSAGELRLVERNCPFLNVATRRPALCSVTVSTLSRLLGYRVIREQRFQNGDGRCVFRLLLDQPIDAKSFRFAFEDELNR